MSVRPKLFLHNPWTKFDKTSYINFQFLFISYSVYVKISWNSMVILFVKSFTMCPCFLKPLAVGQRAYVMANCPLCVCVCARPSVHELTFSVNNFFSETTYRISMKVHRNVPAMVLFRIS